MRVLICGSRDWTDEEAIFTVLDGLAENFNCKKMDDAEFVVIEGGARGADHQAQQWWQCTSRLGCGCRPYHEQYPANWDRYGKAAGPIRNKQMLEEGKPDVVWAFTNKPLSESRGTANMVKQAKEAGLPVYVVQRV